MRGIPIEWRNLLNNATNEELRRWTPGGAPFQHCGMFRKTNSDRKEWRDLNRLNYHWCYKVIVDSKNWNKSLDERITVIVAEMTRILHRVVRSSELWKAIKNYERVLKANDLLYRLLLGVVRTGKALTWLELKSQICPLDGEVQTLDHVWIHCETAQAVWSIFIDVYNKAARGKSFGVAPTNRRDLVGLLALGPGLTDKYDKLRWHILYSEAIWQI